MTEITGKIYQMKNAAGTENRFPRTVIEGVLGLSSYLQNQFSSLADIYMPIGGIYQSKTGQEFVYRAAPNTIKAKSFTLDRIRGKSLGWNQLVEDVNYTNTQTDTRETLLLWAMWGTSVVPLDNASGNHHYVLTNPASSTRFIFKHNGVTQDLVILNVGVVAGHKMYLHYNTIKTNPTVVGGIEIDGIQFVDLTLLYGSEISGMTDAEILAKFESEYPGYHDYSAGKLISNDASALETVGFNQWDEEWEVGALDSTTGGNLSSSTQIRSRNYIPVIPNAVYYRKNPYSDAGAGHYNRVAFYDSNKNFLGASGWDSFDGNNTFTTPNNAVYMRFYVNASAYAHDICINLSDATRNGQYEPYRKSVLPLNLDDFWVKDGQGNQVHITGGLKSAGSVYDEIVGNKYIKRVGSVDMGTMTWEYVDMYGTMKSNVVPSIYYIPNQGTKELTCQAYMTATEPAALAAEDKSIYTGGDACIRVKDSAYTSPATFKSAMSGVMLNYELATPIEYDLVEPLIYTMKAGTTEARISPNEDGLSAPFCCDMTYSASDNNDADNAQYAATAGRLLNTHTILGQQFNGTQDIGGAISDVSSIDGAIHFDLTNPSSPLVGISTTSPTVRLDVNGEIKGSRLHSTVANGTAPLTVVSSTLVTNLNAEKVGGCTVEQITAPLAEGIASNASRIQSLEDWLVNPSLDELTADELNVIESLRVGKGIFVWDSTNNALRFKGNFYADGFVSAYGTNESEALEALKAWVTANFEPKQS